MHPVHGARLALDRRHVAVAHRARNLHGMASRQIGFLQINDRSQKSRMALLRAHRLAARLPGRLQPDRIEKRDNRLLRRAVARPEQGVSERILALADVAHIEAFAHHDDTAPAAHQFVVHEIRHLRHRNARLRQIDLQRQPPLGIGQTGRRRNEANRASHRLQHQYRIRRAGACVLLVQAQ